MSDVLVLKTECFGFALVWKLVCVVDGRVWRVGERKSCVDLYTAGCRRATACATACAAWFVRS